MRQADPVDLSALSFWERTPEEREEAFAELRRERPVSWHGPFESVLVEHVHAAPGGRHRGARQGQRGADRG